MLVLQDRLIERCDSDADRLYITQLGANFVFDFTPKEDSKVPAKKDSKDPPKEEDSKTVKCFSEFSGKGAFLFVCLFCDS
jgi:hypothetical protein